MPNIPLPDEELTIVERYGMLVVHQGKLPRSRLEWRAPGIAIHLKGSFAGKAYEIAANLALNAAIGRHIPAISLRKVSR